jgi:hypothetical protein
VTQPYLSSRCLLLRHPGSVRRASGFVLADFSSMWKVIQWKSVKH